MELKTVEKNLTPQEARKKILAGESIPHGATIKGSLDLEGATIKGGLYLGGATIEGSLDLEGATIKGSLNLGGATIEDGLDLEGATIEGGLYLGGATIEDGLNLVTKKGPYKICVSLEMAQIVHWAAPTIPLVVVKK